ncbi:unnamed protein product [Calicophoron daubneyi]|uniref:Amino acid transporter transmembrane domain-containing protein n=1 Tax=Calicophoron daubneyi TaxID=300641 RepID=A0AAV2TJV3_CALDB
MVNPSVVSVQESTKENKSSVTLSVEDADDNIMQQTHDPHSMGEHLTAPQALMNLIKGNIGTGILSMPVILKYAGLWTGFILIALSGALATYVMGILVHTAESVIEEHHLDRTKIDYTEAVFYVFKYGPQKLRKPKGKIKHTVNLFLIITQIGFSCVYTLFLTVNLISFLHSFFPHLWLDFYLVAILVCIVLIPLNYTSHMRILAYVSFVANMATVLGLILIFAYLFSYGLKPISTFPVITNTKDILIGFSIAVYTFEGISLVLPIQSKMIRPREFSHPFGVLNVGMIVIVCLNLSLAFFGFLAFGEDAEGSVTLNIPDEKWFALVKPLFLINIFASYMIQFYIPASIFGRLMEKLRCHREASERRRYINLKVMRLALILFCYVMVVVIPRLDLMISLIGALASSMLAFVIPPALDLVHWWTRHDQIKCFWFCKFTKDLIIIVIGLLSFVGGTVATLIQIIEAFGQPEV